MPRMLSRSLVRVATWLACVCLAGPASAQITATPYISAGLTLPIAMVQDPSDPGTQYVVEQGGLVKIIRNGTLQAQPFIDLTAEAACCGERGLLGLAFPSDYARTGRFYLYFTTEGGASTPGGASVVARFRRSLTNPLQADKATRFDLLWPVMPDITSGDQASCASFHGTPRRFVCQPYTNHNGGKMAFGPDGYLYIAFGDGGSGGDPGNQAQRRGTLLGKIVRLDVNVPDADTRGYQIPSDNPFAGGDARGTLDEIWAFGVRNPWRFTFDEPVHGGTGAFTMGDVGQGAWEEIDYVPGPDGGRNFGWRNREGAHDLNQSVTPAFTPLTEPIFEYGDAVGVNNSTSITGGYVYRGTALGAAFQGRYFYADYVSGRVFSLGLTLAADGTATAAGNTEHTSDVNPTNANVASIDVDFYGELYLVKYSGQIVKLAAIVDLDADGLPDALERRYGLDPLSPSGANGASGDPDGDGVLNSVELSQGTHPRGLFTRYLAEGAASAFFQTTIALANPATQAALVHLRFLRDDGTVAMWPVSVAARRRLTIDPGQLGLVFSSSFATIVESDIQIVVERTMRWDRSEYGAHTEAAVASPSSTWHFAEGSQGFFSTFLLLTNTSNAMNSVQVRWLVENGAPVVQSYAIPPLRRWTIDAGAIAALANTSFGIEVTFQDAPGLAERAMYFGTPPDPLWKAGHESAGVSAPALEWFLAEGATGPFFETFVLVSNPGPSPANVTVTYLTSAGQTVTRDKTVPGNSRLTINIETENAPELENAAVATRVQSTNSVPIVVERAQYWPFTFPEWYEAHNSFGVTQPHTHWGLAEGEVGRARTAQTYILLANNGAAPANVTIEFLRETAPPVIKTFTVPGQSRYNVPVGAGTQVPELGDEKFGAVITSSGPIVVERALYLSSIGMVWSAGTNATATRLP